MRLDELKQTIREQIPCTDYLTPSKSGLYCCPLCGSGTGVHNTGALKYFPETNTFHCNKCGKSGDVIDIIQKENACDFKTALRIGADLLNIPFDTAEETQSDRKPKKDNSINGTAKAPQIENRPLTQEEQDKRDSLIQWYASKNNLQFVAMYDYCYGKYQDGLAKVKYLQEDGEKTFRWIRRDQTQKSGFSMNRNGCKNRLFTAGDPDEYIYFICEGEKDALTAHSLYGFTAVSVQDGATTGNAGNKWKPEYSEQIQGRDVYIFCDNDEAGRNFASIEAMKASETAHTVYLMDIAKIWEACPEHGDITDMVEALGNDRAKELIDNYIAIARPFGEPEQEKDYLEEFLEKIQGRAFEPYKTELPFFDSLMGGGVQPQSLVLLMASPATGKTTLCQQLAETMAKHGKPIVYLNLEMSREQMLAKSIATRIRQKHPESRINANTVLRGYDWDATQRKQIPAEVEAYRREIFPYLQYNPNNTGHKLSDIENLLHELGETAKATGKQAPAIVLDYLHLVSPDKNIDTAEHIKQVVMTLKEYAINYNTFVIGIVAINRQSKGRITLESGRDSSNIEYTADAVLSLEYKAIDNGSIDTTDPKAVAEEQQKNPREMIIRVLKSRFGEVGRDKTVCFDAEAGYFYEQKQEPRNSRPIRII